MSKAKKLAAKKPVRKNITVPFNKKNVLALADSIYSDKGGVVSFLKLCAGTLSNGKDGGRTLHCAVGEAYHMFVDNDMRKVLKVDDEYLSEPSTAVAGSTAAAIEALVEKAELKNKNISKRDLTRALSLAVNANDSNDSEENIEDFVKRSQDVAEVFRNKVAPLLK